ncbi:MAG: RNA polymerase sigma factor [Isosphaeraceae bacterium]
MESTSTSLLLRAQSGQDPAAWERLVAIYRPFIYGWLRRHSASHQDAEDLTQEVLTILVRELPGFSHSGRVGAFRRWLRATAANRMRSFWRAGRCRPLAGGNTEFLVMVHQIEDDTSDLSKLWDQQHDQHVLARIIESIENEFEPTTVQAFRRLTFDLQPAADVAAALGLTVPAVYIAKSRVLRRIRQEASGMLD